MIQYVDDYTALLSGQSWSASPGAPMVITYSFDTSAAGYLDDESLFTDAFINSFRPFTAQQQGLTQQALQEWQAASGITFVQVDPGQGDIRFGRHNFALDPGMSSFNGFGYYPSRGVEDSYAFENALGGDVFINAGYDLSYNLILHEIGHAIGLEHPFSGDVQLQPAYDNGFYTVMSYNRDSRDSGMGVFDRDAITHLYGDAAVSPSETGGVQAFRVHQPSLTVTQIWGAANSDIFGSSLHDVVDAGAGADRLAGFAGHDLLDGGAGDDTVFGGAGNDTLRGGAGNDRLYGGDFDGDAAAGVDTASFIGVRAAVTVNLGQGDWNGTFFVNASSTETGEDELNDIDHVIGGLGSDAITGDAAANTLSGGNGFDTLSGGAGNDLLMGEAYADLLNGGDGDDSLDGGAGFDVLNGDAGQDTLRAGDDADRLHGGAGNDQLYGGSNVGLTVDGLFGEAGNDSLFGQAGYDLLDGGDGDDLLDGGHQADNLYGQAGNDTLRGDLGLDRLFGGDGDDFGRGGDGDDGLFGEAGNDRLFGEAGNDRFFGGAGDDFIDAGAGNDIVYAGAGFDTILGGAGDDILQGNFNADEFAFVDGHGHDTISDFDATSDAERLNLRNISEIANFSDLLADHMAQSGADVVITTGTGTSITLIGVALGDLDQADFIL